MPLTTVNPWHWLNEDGSFPEDPKLRRRVLRVAQCIEYGGTLPIGYCRFTLIPCIRRPGGVACSGLMMVLKQSDDAILSFCLTCQQDEFLIYEWQDTEWADGLAEPLSVAALNGGTLPEQGVQPEPRVPSEPHDEPLARALELVGSSLSAAVVRRRISTAHSPNEVIQAIVMSCQRPPDRRSMERLLPVLIEAWNATPRPELSGWSPADVQAATPPAQERPTGKAKIGRNAPCPCGSGRKYKRCCGTH